jgi:hypothetical protein
MRHPLLSAGTAFAALGLATQAQAQTVTITYHLNVAIPTLGTAMLLILGLVLFLGGAIWFRKNPQSSLNHFALGAVTIGLVTSLASGGWLVSNAQAVIAASNYLMSDNPSPAVITQFPAVLENDFEESAYVFDVEVTGCQTPAEVTGTCEAGLTIPGGGSCSIDSVCADGVVIAVEGVDGDILVPTACAPGEYSCQAQTICESITGEACVFQQYDCYTGAEGSWYPTSGDGGSSFNFAFTYDFGGGTSDYGNICACDLTKMDEYGLAQTHTYCGVGHWTRQ